MKEMVLRSHWRREQGSWESDPRSIFPDRCTYLIGDDYQWQYQWYELFDRLHINPRTDGGGGYPPPGGFSWITEKPRRAAPRNLAWLFLHSFYTLCARCNFLTWKVRSPGQFEWPDLKSPFCNFERPHQSQSRWPSALKLAGCNERIEAYNLYIWDFLLYRWSKVRFS